MAAKLGNTAERIRNSPLWERGWLTLAAAMLLEGILTLPAAVRAQSSAQQSGSPSPFSTAPAGGKASKPSISQPGGNSPPPQPQLSVKQQYEQDIAAQKRIIQQDPTGIGAAQAWSEIGNDYDHLGQYQQGISARQNTLRLNPLAAPERVAMGHDYGLLGQYQQAVALEKKGLQTDINYGDGLGWGFLGEAYFHLGQYQLAVSAYKEGTSFISVDPEVKETLWSGLGFSYLALNQDKEAFSAFEEAVNTDLENVQEGTGCLTPSYCVPAFEPAWVGLGVSAIGVGDYHSAGLALDEAMRLRPDDSNAWIESGEMACLAHLPARSAQAQSRLQTLDPAMAQKLAAFCRAHQ